MNGYARLRHLSDQILPEFLERVFEGHVLGETEITPWTLLFSNSVTS